jgi:hypothetical protein
MPHDCKVYNEDAHGEHGCNKDFSRQHMTRGTFRERHCSGSRQQPHGPREDMSNQYGRIGHGLLGDNIRGPEPETFRRMRYSRGTAEWSETGNYKERASGRSIAIFSKPTRGRITSDLPVIRPESCIASTYCGAPDCETVVDQPESAKPDSTVKVKER